jgi:hypothetical protein
MDFGKRIVKHRTSRRFQLTRFYYLPSKVMMSLKSVTLDDFKLTCGCGPLALFTAQQVAKDLPQEATLTKLMLVNFLTDLIIVLDKLTHRELPASFRNVVGVVNCIHQVKFCPKR